LGEFDFTYELPNNFDKRVYQFLQQMQEINAAEAFRQCSYEYDDVGLAYYAGLRGDNWNKKAIDITFEGPAKAVTLLKNKKMILDEALGKAIKPSESGYLVRDIYFFEDDIPFDNMPSSNENRLNADIETANIVLADLIQIGERVCLNHSFNASSSENSINDYFRDMLFAKGYKEVKDQTRHGMSVNGKDAAEVDILLTKDGKEIAIYEGLKIDSVNQTYIDTHIDKAIINYNALGTATFIVAYVNSSNFESFWERYSLHIENYDFPLEIRKDYYVRPHPNAAMRVATMVLTRDGYDFPVYYLAIKIG